MDYGPSKSDARKGSAQTGLPESPVIPLCGQVRPKAEHELRDDLARGGSWASGIVDGCVDLVLRVCGQRGDVEPMWRTEICSQLIMHTVSDCDFKTMQQAKRHLRKGNILLVERNRIAQALRRGGEIPLQSLSGDGAFDFV